MVQDVVETVSNKYKKLEEWKLAAIISSIVVGLVLFGLLFLKLRRLLLAFIIGSSVASTIFSLSYLGYTNIGNDGIKNYEYMAVYIPLLYGAFNVLNSGLTKYFSKIKYLPLIMPALIGGVHGIVFSVMGRYLMGNIPVVNFKFEEGEEWLDHIYSFMTYAIIYGVVISFINKLYFIY